MKESVLQVLNLQGISSLLQVAEFFLKAKSENIKTCSTETSCLDICTHAILTIAQMDLLTYVENRKG